MKWYQCRALSANQVKIPEQSWSKLTNLKNFKYQLRFCMIQRFWKGVALYVGSHGWPTKKILGFTCSKRAKITLESIRFLQTTLISIFKFSTFLYTMKVCQWDLINFSKFANALIRKEKKCFCSSQWEKKTEKSWTLFYKRLFHKVL